MNDSVQRECHAKVNLFLRVLALESDGFHGIETLFCRVSLADRLEVERIPSGITLEVDGPDIGPIEENLAWRAAELALAASGRRFGVRMRLTKRIPAGAGLGGGSSDAAAALHAVNQLADLVIPRAELLHLGSRLGADVAFFVSESPLALAWGHGERLLCLPSLPDRPMLLLIPPVQIATAKAYRWIDAERNQPRSRGGVQLVPGVLADWGDIARMAGNDFEAAVFARHRSVRAAFEALAATHPMLCRLSGSGGALLAVYRTESDQADAKAMLGSRHGQVLATRPG